MPEASLFYFLNFAWQIIKGWAWIILPFILIKPFLFLYLWWRVDNWLKKQKNVLLEIKIPKESLKPIRAMENVMAGIHGAVYHPPDWWEKWIDGQVQLSAAFEIISIGGEPHFFIRTPVAYRDSLEASIYSQYPEAELTEVDDYVKYVPQSIPNKEWNMWGADYKVLKDDHYPIKTYPKFETEHETKEEKRVDPVATLLESMAKVKPGEQLWIQIIAEPISETPLKKWLAAGEVLRDKLARRPEKSAQRPIISEAAQILITGKVGEEKITEEKDIIPPEMKLTPGEKEALLAIEGKMSKPIFKCTLRFIWLGKRDVYFKPNFRLAFAFFNSYTTLNLNALFPTGETLTKIHKSWFLPKNIVYDRRLYLRCRKIFRNYINRFTPFWPKPGGTFHLNTEETASLFHFPSKTVAPTPGVPRVESKKRGASLELPSE